MRVSDRYIGRQVLTGTIFAILFLTVILIMGTVLQQIKLLLDFGADLSVVPTLIAGSLPFSLVYTIPWAFLSSVLLTYGRMSRDQELTGFRVAGISLFRLSLPVFVIGISLSGICLWLNTTVTPEAARGVEKIKLDVFRKNIRGILKAAVEQDGLERLESRMKGTKAYISSYSDKGDIMQGLHIFRNAPEESAQSAKKQEADDPPRAKDVYVYAKKAEILSDDNEIQLKIHDAVIESTDDNGLPLIVQAREAVPLTLPYDVPEEKKKRPKAMSNQQIRDYMASQEWAEQGPGRIKAMFPRFASEIPRRYASSFACLAFAFVGIPLGIKARRRDTSTGLVMSLLIGTAYFAASAFNSNSLTGILVLNWAPNVICIGLGLVLFYRAQFR